jgi:hypothetical protein
MEEWLKENLSGVWEKEFWPPSSPNYSLLDLFYYRKTYALISN